MTSFLGKEKINGDKMAKQLKEYSEEDFWDLEEELLMKYENRRDRNVFMDSRHY